MDIRRILDKFIDTTGLTDKQLSELWYEWINLPSPSCFSGKKVVTEDE